MEPGNVEQERAGVRKTAVLFSACKVSVYRPGNIYDLAQQEAQILRGATSIHSGGQPVKQSKGFP
jgi:hypothetical protein